MIEYHYKKSWSTNTIRRWLYNLFICIDTLYIHILKLPEDNEELFDELPEELPDGLLEELLGELLEELLDELLDEQLDELLDDSHGLSAS